MTIAAASRPIGYPLAPRRQPAGQTAPTEGRPTSTTDQLNRTRRYAGSLLPFGVGACIEARYGVDEIREGHTKDGIIDVVRGVAGVINNGNLLVVLSSFVPIAGSIVHLAGTAGAIASIVTSPLDGGRDLADGVTRKNRETALIGAWKLCASGLTIAGGLTANPLLIVAGTVVNVSAVLFQNRQVIKTELPRIPGKMAVAGHHVVSIIEHATEAALHRGSPGQKMIKTTALSTPRSAARE